MAFQRRYLQLSKNGQLYFHNNNLGINEQWDLQGGEPSLPWERAAFRFVNRKGEALEVELERKGRLVAGQV